MPTSYVTLKQSDADFFDYLWGRPNGKFKKNQRAIPVKTYNLGTPEESVTFELKDIADIKKISRLNFFSSLVKLNSFILVLGPLFYILTKNYITGKITDPFAISLAAFSEVLLFAGFNIRNDVNDHISGFDRVNLDANYNYRSKPIRLGWISAHRASSLSLILFSIAGIFALPVVWWHSELIWIISVALLLFFLGRFARNNSYKQQHFGEFILFILAGPALAAGYQMALGAGIDKQALSFGMLWGVAVLYLIQVNNFSHLMTSSQAGINNTMTKLGFDRAQIFLIWAWVLFLGLWAGFHYLYANIYWTVFGTLLLVAWSLPFFKKIRNIKSPMGSGLQLIRKEAHKTFLVMVLIFLSENIWSLWVNFEL